MRRAQPLFDLYVMVDWSAAAVPRQGRDSVWITALKRTARGLRTTAHENPPTRHAAHALLRELLTASARAREMVLAGFDFPLAYPGGLARHLKLDGPPWRAVWDAIAELVEDRDDNGNNRFAAAAALNERLSGDAYPFWGCPASAAGRFLDPWHHRRHCVEGFPERRLVEERMTGPQPAWKLAGAGSAGGQALTGIPVLRRLRDDGALRRSIRVWPFETGLAPPKRRGIVFAEIYPSMVAAPTGPGEVKDSAQVRHLARYFATLDDSGDLARLFAGDPALTPEERRRVEREEGWVLGVTREGMRRAPAAPRYRYLKDPAAISRRSFARIRRETRVDDLPREIRTMALRLVHASAEPALLEGLRWSAGAVTRGCAALAQGAPLLVDAKMVAAGIGEARLSKRSRILCMLEDRRVPKLARRLGTTRSAAAVELWRPHLEGAVVAIGNAPTALFHLLEMIGKGAPRPALVLGFPVGFVGAAEAKAALAENPFGLAYITLLGRRGGSALAAAAVNALAGDTPGSPR